MRDIELKPSRLLGLLLMSLLLLALLAVTQATLPGALQLALLLVVAAVGGWSGWRATPITSLRIAADGQLQSLDDAAEWRDVEVLGDSFVSPALIVLRFRIDSQPVRSLTLLPDSASADDLRRLRVSLRWARHTRSDTSSPGAD